MKTWIRMAWIEWRRSALVGRPNRDFLSLTALLFLTLLLALLLWGGREGLLNRFVDVSVGRLKDDGIPIWLAAKGGIDRNLLNMLEQKKFKLYPYREVEWQDVSLPGVKKGQTPVWSGTGENAAPAFLGWAVSLTDPLWQTKDVPYAEASNTGLPFDVLLNKSLFKQFFNCQAYQNELRERLPSLVVPAGGSALDCLEDGRIWLEVKGRDRRDLLPFRVHWQDHIPTLESLAMLFPLNTLEALKLASLYPGLEYYPELQEGSTVPVKELMVRQDGKPLSPESLDSLIKKCMPQATRKSARIILSYPLPHFLLVQCLEQQNDIPLAKDNENLSPPYIFISEMESPNHFFRYEFEHFLNLVCRNKSECYPCQSVPVLDRLRSVKCESTKARIDLIEVVGSYQKGFAYVKDRSALTTEVERIKNFQGRNNERAFYIHYTYGDALVRFQFIDRIMALLETSFMPFFLLFLLLLLTVQVGIIISHRRHNYGILLAKGLAWSQIRWMIFSQITISFAVAIALATLVSEIMQGWLGGELGYLTQQKPFIDHIVIGGLDLLPLNLPDYSLVGSAVIGILYLIAGFLFWRMLPLRHKEPAYLF